MDKIKQLQAIIDELQYESRKIEFSSEVERLKRRVQTLEKIEFSSEVERLKRRVQTLEEQIELIKIILQDVSK